MYPVLWKLRVPGPCFIMVRTTCNCLVVAGTHLSLSYCCWNHLEQRGLVRVCVCTYVCASVFMCFYIRVSRFKLPPRVSGVMGIIQICLCRKLELFISVSAENGITCICLLFPLESLVYISIPHGRLWAPGQLGRPGSF